MAGRSGDIRLLAGLLLAGELTLLALSVLDGSWGEQGAPFPFAWRDVAVVHVACAAPLAAILAAAARRFAPLAALAVAAGSLAVSAALLLGVFRVSLLNLVLSSSVAGLVLRAGLALGLAFTAAVCWLLLYSGGAECVGRPWKENLTLSLLSVAALLFVPWVYSGARCRHDVTRLAGFLDQRRIAEARNVAYGMVLLDPQREWRRRPLRQWALELDQAVGDLERATSNPLPAGANARQRIDRARRLAMLGQTDAALETLAAIRDLASLPEAQSLRGAIYEARGDWSDALACHEKAKEAWLSRADSSERTEGLVTAATGMGFALRKLGRYAEAEVAFVERLSLDGGAESHFLLAQYYEDTQQTQKAQTHARRAMELAPKRYEEEGTALIRRMSVFQFGCLGVERGE